MDSPQELIGRLQQVRHFSRLPESDLHRIVTSGQIGHYQEGQTIFSESEPCAGMYVLLSGQVHLCKLGPQGQVNIIAVIDPVIMFNEVAVLDGGANPTTAIAVQDSTTWRVSCKDFQALLERYPQVGLGLLQVLAKRNRRMIEHYEDLSFRPVAARAAKLLLDLSANGQLPIHRRDHSIQEMAGRIATVPEAISRSLNTFKSLGLIHCSRVMIQVLQPAELARQAQIDPDI